MSSVQLEHLILEHPRFLVHAHRKDPGEVDHMRLFQVMGLLDVINWRDAALAACDCWAGVLGDQAVNAVGQNPGLTARNQAHGELTASNQSLDHTRGDAQAPRDPGLRNPWRAVWNFVSPSKELSSTISSNSRPSECDSSWFAHFDSDKMIRHHRDVEKDLRYGLLEPEPTRFRRSSACFGS